MRRAVPFAIVACAVLASCKAPAPQVASPDVTGSMNVAVRSTAVYAADIRATASSQAYYLVCRITFTNTLGHDVAPSPSNFVFYDAYGQPYYGVDSGTASLIGVSNYRGVVKPDDKQDYIVGFRVPNVTSGAVYYASY